MKRKSINYLCLTGLCAAVFFSNCKTIPYYDFICQNTMSIYILNDGKNYYVSIPVQYIGNYQIETFDFLNGSVLIGDYKILLERENIKINILLNTLSDEYGNTKGEFEDIYLENNGKIIISKMKEPIIKNETDNTMNQYNINIERILNKNEIENIINEYKKGNIYSSMNIWYNIFIDIDNYLAECGMLDDFELKVKYK